MSQDRLALIARASKKSLPPNSFYSQFVDKLFHEKGVVTNVDELQDSIGVATNLSSRGYTSEVTFDLGTKGIHVFSVDSDKIPKNINSGLRDIGSCKRSIQKSVSRGAFLPFKTANTRRNHVGFKRY